MAAHRHLSFYSDFLRDFLRAMVQRTDATGIGYGVVSNPNIVLYGINSGYVFDAATSTLASISPYLTSVIGQWDGEDPEQARFDNGRLWLCDKAAPIVETPGLDTAALVLAVAHGSATQLVCHWSRFNGWPFECAVGDTPGISWAGPAGCVFDMVSATTADHGIYPRAAEEALGLMFGGTTRHHMPATHTIKCDLMSIEAHYVWAHRHLKDIPSTWWARTDIGVAQILALTAAKPTGSQQGYNMVYFSSGTGPSFNAATGKNVFGVLLWQTNHTGTENNCLLAFMPFYANPGQSAFYIPLVGQDVILTAPNALSVNYIMEWTTNPNETFIQP